MKKYGTQEINDIVNSILKVEESFKKAMIIMRDENNKKVNDANLKFAYNFSPYNLPILF